MRTAAAHLCDPVLEVLLFSVGGVRYGVCLDQVVGVVHDLPRDGDATPPSHQAQTLLFEGETVPVFPADDFLYDMGPEGSVSREAIIFDDGRGLYGMAIDSTDTVVGVIPGDELYVLPPQAATAASPCRAWGILTVADHPVILLDMSRVLAH
jgi:hypothetical protein